MGKGRARVRGPRPLQCPPPNPTSYPPPHVPQAHPCVPPRNRPSLTACRAAAGAALRPSAARIGCGSARPLPPRARPPWAAAAPGRPGGQSSGVTLRVFLKRKRRNVEAERKELTTRNHCARQLRRVALGVGARGVTLRVFLKRKRRNVEAERKELTTRNHCGRQLRRVAPGFQGSGGHTPGLGVFEEQKTERKKQRGKKS